MQFVARATSRLVTRVDAARGIWERSSFLPTFCKFSTAADFEKAVSALNSVEDVDNDVKLQLYGLYKQATVGNITGDAPNFTQFVARHKFNAWKACEGLTTDEAKSKYAEIVAKLSKNTLPNQTEKIQGSEGIKVSKEGRIFKIELCRPDKFNALTWSMYEDLITALDESNRDKETSITVLTGAGKYYCSGNDLSNFTRNVKSIEDMKRMADDGEKILERFVRAHIEHNKPLVSLVNGPAIGIVVTTLSLFDMVIASSKATFSTPFTTLGQSPEGCSSYTFPLLMGPTKACEVLLFNKQLSAEEAFERNLVTTILPYESFPSESQRYIKTISELPPESLRINKMLLRDAHRKKLLEVNIEECRLLKSRWLSTECQEAIRTFMARKK